MSIINQLYKWSRRKIREDHMDTHHTDIKCVNCSDLLDEYQQIDLFRMMDRKIGVL